MKDRIILHCDANSFYASVECALNPELRDKPLAVSGNPEKRTGIILAKNEIAKKYNIKTGEAIWEAKEKCPSLVCVFPRHDVYEKFSKKLQAIYESYTPYVEAFGIDECWLDITETEHLFGGAMKVANEIRERVKAELGITVSIGVSFCKLFAKLGSDLKKPDAVTLLSRFSFKQLTYSLPISSIVGIGRRIELRLNKMNIFTLGDLAKVPEELLVSKFGIIGRQMSQKVRGYDDDEVKSLYEEALPKSVGNGTTTIMDISSEQEVRAVIVYLLDQICSRMRAKNLCGSTISVSIKNCLLRSVHHSRSLGFFTNSVIDLREEVMSLIDSFWNYDEKIRALRICVSGLAKANFVQSSLFEYSSNKKMRLNYTIDFLRNKYGKNIIKLADSSASFINAI